MSQRIIISGKPQGLDGDRTSTGAICLASQTSGMTHSRYWLREGDKTTPCPRCGKEGTIINGESHWRHDGRPCAVDGTPVQCGCPPGSNVVLASSHPRAVPTATSASQPSAPAARPAQVSTPAQRFASASSAVVTASSGGLEPGFHIVQRSSSFSELLLRLFDQHGALPITRLQWLNPTYAQGFKAGEIFVIGDPDNGHACTREEANLMAAAERAREALADMTTEEADFMMRHQAEIAGLLSDVSLAMGVTQAIMARSLDNLRDTLRHIEKLHQEQFAKHGHLKSAEFFASRKALFEKLDGQLRSAFLNKHMDLGDHTTLRRDLGISSKSLVHHWSKAGGPGQIPGYSTHLDKIATMSKYLKYGGHVGIIIGGASSILKIKEACRAGETEACKKIRFTEAGSFAGGLAGGTVGGVLGGVAVTLACASLGPISTTVCAVALVGTGSLAGSIGGMATGEFVGEAIYEKTLENRAVLRGT